MDKNIDYSENLLEKPKTSDNTYFNIELKGSYTLKHLLSIPLVMVSFNIISTYTNTQMVFLLRNKDYFNVP